MSLMSKNVLSFLHKKENGNITYYVSKNDQVIKELTVKEFMFINSYEDLKSHENLLFDLESCSFIENKFNKHEKDLKISYSNSKQRKVYDKYT